MEKSHISGIYIPNGVYGSFYFKKGRRLIRAYIPIRTRQISYVVYSSYSCLKELQKVLTEEGIFYIHTTATNPKEFITLHPEHFI